MKKFNQAQPNSLEWRDDAACMGEDPELFFPVGRGDTLMRGVDAAKNVCRRCVVVDSCLDWAIESGSDFGVWGGLSEDERRALRNRRARKGA